MEYLFNDNDNGIAGLNGYSPPEEVSGNADLSAFINSDFFVLDNLQFGDKDFYAREKQQAQDAVKNEFDFANLKQNQNGAIGGKIVKDQSDDKRRRNTLASARFRIKKKMKEQMMENELNELTKKVEELKSTITKLEMENKCLKSLVIAKSEKKSEEMLSSIRLNATK